MAQSYTPTTFAAAVLKRVGAPVNRANLQALVGWEKAEGGHWNNDAKFNPLNTTLNMPGSGDTGSQGNISSYRDWEQGLAATVKTLKNGLYPNILSALKKGNNPASVGAAVGNSPWCPGCGAYATRVIQQTKIPNSVVTSLSAQQGGLAQTVTSKPSTPLASAAQAAPTLKPPTTQVVQTSRVVEPDTSAQDFIGQMASQLGQGTTPAGPQGGLNAGYSKYLSQRPVPGGGGGPVTTPAPGVGAQLAGLSQLVGPSTIVGTKTVTTPGKSPTPVASAAAIKPPKKVTPAPSQDAGADRASSFANAHIGAYAESAGSNRGPQLDKLEGLSGFPGSGQPWCAMFATTAAVHGGAPKSARTAAVAVIAANARTGSNGYKQGILPTSMARKGDLIMRNTAHVGFVDGRTADGSIIVIEGNANGSGGVARRVYPVHSRWTGIARPNYQR